MIERKDGDNKVESLDKWPKKMQEIICSRILQECKNHLAALSGLMNELKDFRGEENFDGEAEKRYHQAMGNVVSIQESFLNQLRTEANAIRKKRYLRELFGTTVLTSIQTLHDAWYLVAGPGRFFIISPSQFKNHVERFSDLVENFTKLLKRWKES